MNEDERIRNNPEITFDELWNEEDFPLDTPESVKGEEVNINT